jgi:hypothetical protein
MVLHWWLPMVAQWSSCRIGVFRATTGPDVAGLTTDDVGAYRKSAHHCTYFFTDASRYNLQYERVTEQ